METQKIYIVNVLETGPAFAVTDQGEGVFIPRSVAGAAGADLGMELHARLVPNRQMREDTPWMAVFATRHEPDVPAASAEDKVTSLLSDGYMTTPEIADSLDMTTTDTSNLLNAMFVSGKLAKASVYANNSQTRASFLLWANSAEAFVE